ncbi:MAG: hypothetical protein AB1815_02225 [Bacillota bacterium]
MVAKLLDSVFGRFRKRTVNEGTATREIAAAREPEVKAYLAVSGEIDRMIAEGEIMGWKKMEQEHLIIYSLGNRKMININKHGSPPRTCFLFSGANQLAKEMEVKGLRPLSKNEAKQKGYGPAKAIYTGDDPEVIRNMVKSVK